MTKNSPANSASLLASSINMHYRTSKCSAALAAFQALNAYYRANICARHMTIKYERVENHIGWKVAAVSQNNYESNIR